MRINESRYDRFSGCINDVCPSRNLHFIRRTYSRNLIIFNHYRTIFDHLIAIHGIYRSEGYRIIHEEPYSRFGPELIKQVWELELV